MSIHDKAARVKLLLFDVDGVLTDGKVLLHADGSESKNFDIKDGIAMVWAQRVGLTVGILSARHSPTTPHRAAQLGITLVYHGVTSKLETYEEIVSDLFLEDGQVAYMGDDIVDLAVLARAGLSAAPADAVAEVRARVDWVSERAGGDGAARELVELVLRAQGLWESLVSAYEQQAGAGEHASLEPAAVSPPAGQDRSQRTEPGMSAPPGRRSRDTP
jgi:3-deoxy-D-manno-octulosonate 8-phosphate phosphatase (KDO 8-P phosphatase)